MADETSIMILRNGTLNTISNATQRASVLLIYFVAARGMDAHSFGVASSLIVLAITIGSISSLSLGHTVNRTMSRLRVERLKQKAGIAIAQISILTSFATAFLFFAFSVVLVHFVTGETISTIDTLFIAVAIAAISIGSCMKGFLWAAMRYDILLVTSVASAAALLAGYAISTAVQSALPLLQAYVVMVCTEAVILIGGVVAPLGGGGGGLTLPNWRVIRPIVRFSGLATLNGLVSTPINILLVSMITASLGTEVVGRFNFLMQIRNAIVFIPQGFAAVLLTLMSRARRPSKLWLNSMLLGALAVSVSLPVGIIAYIWRPHDAINNYIQLLTLTGATGVVIALNINFGLVFVALGRLGIGIFANILLSAMILGFVAIALVSQNGGLATILIGILLAYFLHSFVQIALIFKYGKTVK